MAASSFGAGGKYHPAVPGLGHSDMFQYHCGDLLSAQLAVFLVAHRPQPLVGAALAGHFNGNVAEPGILPGPVPVLDPGWNDDDRAGRQTHCLLAFFLIPALAGRTDQQLTTALSGVVNVPVVPALNWTPPPQSLVVASFNGIHICALCESFLTSSFYQVIFLFLPRSKPLLQG